MCPVTRTVVYVLDQNRYTPVNPSFTILKLSIRVVGVHIACACLRDK